MLSTTRATPKRWLLAAFVLLTALATSTLAHVDRHRLGNYAAFESCLLGPDVSTSSPCDLHDWDGDGDTDLADFAGFQFCYRGDGESPPDACLQSPGFMHDADFDGDVDLEDWANFQNCYQSSSSVCKFAHDFDDAGITDGSIDQADHAGFAACFNGPDTTPPPTCERTITRDLRSTPPPTGTFALHGRPVDVLPDGKTIIYVRARYYDPVNGRWLQRDPKGNIDGPNLYESFGGNPVRFVDPQGELAEELFNLFLSGRFLSNEEIDRATTSGGVGLVQARSRLLSDIGNVATGLGDIDAFLLIPQGFEQGFRQPAIEAASGRFESFIAAQVVAGADIEDASSITTLSALFLGDAFGATQLGEGLFSVDLATNQMLSTGESVRRTVQGGSTIIIIAAGPKALRNARGRSAALRAPRAEATIPAQTSAPSAARTRVLGNIAESQAARAASNFEVFVAREQALSGC